MTDIRPSPEMLDAAAANREAAPLEDRDLDQAIADHRIAYRVETGILKIHQRDGESGIGPPFSPIFQAFLDEQYGSFPWSRSLFWLRHAVCRRSHPEHLRDEWGHGLCFELVSRVIRLDYSLDQVRLQLGLSNEGRTRRTLDSALLMIERHLEQMLDDRPELPPRSPAEWMAPAYHHKPLEGLHAVECPQCLRKAS